MKLLLSARFILSLILMTTCLNVYAQKIDQVRNYSSDTSITSAVKGKFIADPILNSLRLSVTTENRVVNLSGEVDSDTQYERAIIVASNTNGVKDVNATGLKIKSSEQPLSDTYITAKVKALLLKNDLISVGSTDMNSSSWNVHVETKNGTVYLTGQVKSKRQSKEIIAAAKSIKGVKNVKADFTYQP